MCLAKWPCRLCSWPRLEWTRLLEQNEIKGPIRPALVGDFLNSRECLTHSVPLQVPWTSHPQAPTPGQFIFPRRGCNASSHLPARAGDVQQIFWNSWVCSLCTLSGYIPPPVALAANLLGLFPRRMWTTQDYLISYPYDFSFSTPSLIAWNYERAHCSGEKSKVLCFVSCLELLLERISKKGT